MCYSAGRITKWLAKDRIMRIFLIAIGLAQVGSASTPI
jgi:hypothetical protein